MNETDLIKKVKQGDMQAFEQLFELYKYKAIKTVYLMTGDKDASEDIVQEAFVTCYLSIKTLKTPEYFKTWFFKLLTRTAWRYMKKEKKLVPVEEIAEMIEKQQVGIYSDEVEQRESSRLLYQEIEKLEIKLQTTLVLYYYSELSIKEIAKVMGCLEGTVKSRLYTGRNKLKISLIKQENFISTREALRYENK
ncbi:MAG: RNA polymerase sigma factor [Cellulosilyticaceae bacterium]